MIYEIDGESFEDVVAGSDIPVLVDFHAAWCGPCRIQDEVFKRLDSENLEVKLVKIDVDRNEEFASSLGISSVPTLILYRNGEEYMRIHGTRTEAEVKRLLTL